jgi:hypothetical protein
VPTYLDVWAASLDRHRLRAQSGEERGRVASPIVFIRKRRARSSRSMISQGVAVPEGDLDHLR